MTDGTFELTRRKLLGAAGAVGVAGAGAGVGTSALFSDEESFEDNTITAGTLDMSVTAEIVEASEYYTSSGDGPDIIGDMETADGSAVVGLQADDVKPGDWVIICFEVSVEDNPGYVQVSTDNFAQYENGQTEPEIDAEGVDSNAGSLGGGLDGQGKGELQDELVAEVYDNYDDQATSNDPLAYLSGPNPNLSGSARTVFEQFATGVVLGGSATPLEVGSGGVKRYLLLELPGGVGNKVQSDAVEFDLVFDAEQVRNNDGFEPSSNLVGYWPLNSVGDGTAEDLSGNGNDGTIQGGVSPVSGKVADAGAFDGNDDFIRISDGGDVPSGASGEELTVSAWIRVDSDVGLGRRHEVVGIFNEWVLEWNRFNNKTIDLATWGDNTGQGNTTLQEGEWHHVAATWAAGSGGEVTTYVNGSPDKTVGPYGNTSPQTGNDLTVGTFLNGGTPIDPFDGRLDDIRIYDRVLSDQEIQDIANL